MKFILFIFSIALVLTSISAGDDDSLPNSVKQFRDDSTFYQRIEGVKIDIIKPASDNLDSVVNNIKSENPLYVKDLLYAYVAELSDKLDSAEFFYKRCLSRELESGQNYYANLDLARISLKSGDTASAERYLEAYLDTLYFQIMQCDLTWGGGTPDIIIHFMEDHSLYLGNSSQDACGYFFKEYPLLRGVLMELKKFGNSFYIIPDESELRESLKKDGEVIADFIINKDISALMKYVDRDKCKVACVGRNTLSVKELEIQLSDTSSLTYCYLFGGPTWKGKSLRGFLIDAKTSNFRIKTKIFDDGLLLSPIGILTYEWDVDPDFQYKMHFPFTYFLYGKDGWIIMSMFAEW